MTFLNHNLINLNFPERILIKDMESRKYFRDFFMKFKMMVIQINCMIHLGSLALSIVIILINFHPIHSEFLFLLQFSKIN